MSLRPVSPYHFTFFRVVLGLYIVVHFLMLMPYAEELWGPRGMIPEPALNLTGGMLPLAWVNIEGAATGLVITMAVLGLALAIGWQRPTVSVLLWLGWASLFDRNNLIANPGIPYVGWLLLVCAVVPRGEPLSFGGTREGWHLPRVLYIGAWLLMAVGYTISGIDKWMAPSWRDGTAIVHLLENPLARDTWLREWMLSWPLGLHRAMTWSILAMEMLFLPLALFARTRIIAWGGMMLMHLGILCIVDFADLTIGMLMIHVFTLEERWLKPNTDRSGILFFDGVCGLCNSFVDLLFAEDRRGVLRVTPLQGATAQERLPAELRGSNLTTVVYQRNGRTWTRSGAALRVLGDLGGIWKLARLLVVVPAPLRNVAYDFVARHRIRWFGQKDTCRMPTPQERSRFLP